ncbi:MAG: ABC transporter ATP-binding protein [Clostridia bacterium]|nr:ABC transporter ATP-binding protein [Clostridia bacterium]
MNQPVLRVKNVSKAYNDVIAVRNVSFDVFPGEIFGLIGPSESGKSTIIQMICGTIFPTCGSIDIAEKSIIDDFENAIQYIGGSLENANMYENMTGIQNLKYYASLYPSIPNVKERIDSLAHFLELENDLKKLVKDYSRDKLQKLVIAQALLHFPKLLILDEPTKNLDQDSIANMREFLKKVIKKYNIAVLVGSKNLSEMKQLCDTVGVISGGEILDIRSSEDFENAIQLGQRIAFRVNYPNFGAKMIKNKLNLNPYAIGSEIIMKLPEEDVANISEFLAKYNIVVFGVRKISKTFEDIYLDNLNKKQKKSQLK